MMGMPGWQIVKGMEGSRVKIFIGTYSKITNMQLLVLFSESNHFQLLFIHEIGPGVEGYWSARALVHC